MTTDAIDKLLAILETGSGEYINYETLGTLIKLAKTVKIELTESNRECDILENMAMRYEKLRRLNVGQLKELYLEHLKGTASFDSFDVLLDEFIILEE